MESDRIPEVAPYTEREPAAPRGSPASEHNSCAYNYMVVYDGEEPCVPSSPPTQNHTSSVRREHALIYICRYEDTGAACTSTTKCLGRITPPLYIL
eukprot:805761-Pyramimonas_sp.AAC.2